MPTPVRGALAGLPSYEFAAQDVPGVERVIQLGQNELGVPPSPYAIEAAARATGDLNRYPELGHGRLRRAIAGVHGLDSGKVVCGAGSIELMGLLATAYCEPGVEVVVSRFGYKYFQLQCAAAGAALRVAPEPAWRVDVDAVLDAVTDRTLLVYVVNPGNPTGTCLEDGGLARLRARLPERVMLVVDEAYAEFAADAGYETGIDLVDAGRNVVVLRTFSKAYGQDFPMLRLIFREAEEWRLNRHVLAGFRGCGAAHAPTLVPFPAPDDSFSMSDGCPAGPGRCGAQGRVRAAMASRRSSCSRRRVSARLSASRRLAKITASAMLLRLARFAGPWPVRVRQASSP